MSAREAPQFPLGTFREELEAARRGHESTLADLVAPWWWESRHRYELRDAGYTSPCWIWLLSTTDNGYGRVGLRTGRQILAHNLYWERARGPVPAGLELDHLCRVPSCVNPAHMEPVTRTENLRRRPRRHTLIAAQVHAIRASNEPGPVLARRYDVTKTTISHIRMGRTWSDLSEGAA